MYPEDPVERSSEGSPVRRAAERAGPVLFFSMAALLAWNLAAWRGEARALERRDRLRALDARLLDADLEELTRSEELDEIPVSVADLYWDQHLRMVAGTAREAPARTRREASRARRMDRRLAEVSETRRRVAELVSRGRLASAGRLVLALPAALARTPEARALREGLETVLRERAGLVLVGGEEREIGRGADRRRARSRPFLVEAGANPGGMPLAEARAFADQRGMRLPTLLERELAEEALGNQDAARPAAEWVLPDAEDPLWQEGYGLCFAPAPGVLRRRGDRGHPDVGFRCLLDLERAAGLEASGKLHFLPAVRTTGPGLR